MIELKNRTEYGIIWIGGAVIFIVEMTIGVVIGVAIGYAIILEIPFDFAEFMYSLIGAIIWSSKTFFPFALPVAFIFGFATKWIGVENGKRIDEKKK